MLTARTDVPQMGHSAKSPLAKFLSQVYLSGTWCVGSSDNTSFWVNDTKVTQETLSSCRTLLKEIDRSGVFRRRYVVGRYDNVEGGNVGYRDDDASRLPNNAMTADDPLEMPSQTLSLFIVRDLSSNQGTQVFDDGAVVLVESQAKVKV